jgi:uncharacterized protein with beta-barrel porin domain
LDITVRRARTLVVIVTALLVTAAVILGFHGAQPAAAAAQRAEGAGRTIIQGGTGGTAPTPVTTLVAFHAGNGSGDFECLALAPPRPTGPGSGEFTTNVMYVTGSVRSVTVRGHTAVLRGVATVTGIGAGQHQPFTATVTAGGPGATLVLNVSGLEFDEILVDGHFTIG